MQTKAIIITLASSAGMGTALGFNTPAAIVYTDANTTPLLEPLNENEMSWNKHLQILQIETTKVHIIELIYI